MSGMRYARLENRTKTVKVITPSWSGWVECPVGYDREEITAEEVIADPLITPTEDLTGRVDEISIICSGTIGRRGADEAGLVVKLFREGLRDRYPHAHVAVVVLPGPYKISVTAGVLETADDDENLIEQTELRGIEYSELLRRVNTILVCAYARISNPQPFTVEIERPPPDGFPFSSSSVTFSSRYEQLIKFVLEEIPGCTVIVDDCCTPCAQIAVVGPNVIAHSMNYLGMCATGLHWYVLCISYWNARRASWPKPEC